MVEIVGGLALAADLGTGQPLEHQFRTCLRSMHAADQLGITGDDLRDVYYLALLRFIGCTASSLDNLRTVRGDEVRFIAAMAPVFMGGPRQMVPTFLRAVGRELPPLRRAATIARAMADTDGAHRAITADCEVASRLAGRIGLGDSLQHSLQHAFERWDGAGIPGELAGDEVPMAVRVVVPSRDAELWIEEAEAATAEQVLLQRRGRAYDPAVVDALLADGPLTPLDDEDLWQRVVDAEPLPALRIVEHDLDETLTALADFTDLKSPYTLGHSRGVADLAAAAAETLDHDPEGVVLARRAALTHDLGRVGIPLSIWDNPDPLSRGDLERIRLHPYLTERVLANATTLRPVARVAGGHHERLDGSGYHRSADGDELGACQRVVAAADCYQAMTQPRAHRPARTSDEAAEELRAEADGGRLDRRAVEAVLEAAGHDARPTVDPPAGLTERQLEVLRLIAAGRTNKQVAAELVISPKTVGTHVEHIYSRIGVSTRAAAAVFAMEQGLL